MRSSTITRKLASVVAATLLASGLLAWNASPAAAACNSTEVYVTVVGSRHGAPTNGCVGPSDWGLFYCDEQNTELINENVIVEADMCIALPV